MIVYWQSEDRKWSVEREKGKRKKGKGTYIQRGGEEGRRERGRQGGREGGREGGESGEWKRRDTDTHTHTLGHSRFSPVRQT